MTRGKHHLSRRDFVRAGTGAAVAGVLGLDAGAADEAAAPATSQVVLVRHRILSRTAGRLRRSTVRC